VSWNSVSVSMQNATGIYFFLLSMRLNVWFSYPRLFLYYCYRSRSCSLVIGSS
jgi:hypothetical protein